MPVSEIAIQTRFRNRCAMLCPSVLLVAVPNAAKRSPCAAAQVKREGLARGFPDMIALGPNGLAAFIEFKSAMGRVSVDQSEWHERLERNGFPLAVCRDVDSAVAFLRSCGFPFLAEAA